jgi:hypothetical protein
MGIFGRLDGGSDLLGKGEGSGPIGFGQKDDEFLASVAGGKVRGSTVGAQDLGSEFEAVVAGWVAVSIVVVFEVIEIEQEDRARTPEASRSR